MESIPAISEPIMLGEQDHEEACIPVPKQRQEVLENEKEVVPSRDTNQEDSDEDYQGPEETWDEGEGLGELLDREGAGINRNAVHANTTHYQNHQQELCEASRI